ncbi:hypothetical protein ACHAP5_003548, partial [Fusarium lateritium]
TMLIFLTKDSTSFTQGYTTVVKCKSILTRFGHNGVDVEMREGELTRCMLTPDLPEFEMEEEKTAVGSIQDEQDSEQLTSNSSEKQQHPIKLLPGLLHETLSHQRGSHTKKSLL